MTNAAELAAYPSGVLRARAAYYEEQEEAPHTTTDTPTPLGEPE